MGSPTVFNCRLKQYATLMVICVQHLLLQVILMI